MVVVKWLGHACFEIRNNVSIVTDPHDGRALGIRPPKANGDIVLISHDHFDHIDGRKLVAKPDAQVISKAGRYEVKGVKIEGFGAFHDKSKGSQRGQNIIFVFELEGIRFCHVGDLGHTLSSEQIKQIGAIDVLMVPVGGTYTVDAKEATQLVDQLKPKLVIPMHYNIAGLNLPISSVEDFLKGKTNVKRIESSEFTISKQTLPEKTEIAVLRF